MDTVLTEKTKKAKVKKPAKKSKKKETKVTGHRKGENHHSYNRTKVTGGLLTERQTQVLRLVSLGCAVAEISILLELAQSTVDNHKAAMMASLGITKSTLLVRKAIELGLTKADERLSQAEMKKLGTDWVDGWNRVGK